MKTIKITAFVSYDDVIAEMRYKTKNKEYPFKDWFYKDVLKSEGLAFISPEYGDFFGEITITGIEEVA